MRLYELPAAIREIEAEIIEADGELTPEVEARLEALEGEFRGKAEHIALLSREAKAEAAAVKLEEDRLAARRRAAENRERRLKDYLHACMTAAGLDHIESERCKLRVQRNGQPSVRVDVAPDALPEMFRRVVVDADRAALLAAWKESGEVPAGVVVEFGTHLRIR